MKRRSSGHPDTSDAVPRWTVPASQVALGVKKPPANTGDLREVGSIPGWGRSPGKGHGSPLQESCLENLTVKGAWGATVHGVAESDTTEQLSTCTDGYAL